MTLEEYLTTDHEENRADIAALERAISAAAKTLERAFIRFKSDADEYGYWDYEIRPIPAAPHNDVAFLSVGTVAMVLAAVGKISGKDLRWVADVPDTGTKDELASSWDLGLKTLVAGIVAQNGILSKSFGANDPITHSHVAEVLRGTATQAKDGTESPGDAEALLNGLSIPNPKADGTNAVDALKSLLSAGPVHGSAMLPGLGEGRRYLPNAFVPLRIVRAHRLLGKLVDSGSPSVDFRAYFEAALHQQLSFSLIQDSRFDPAELMFALEGVALLAPQAIDGQLLSRVLEVLEVKQKESAHWRPAKPIFATPHGMTMLPISVEGVNSLLRSLMILCEGRPNEFSRFDRQCVTMVRRFWQWLRSRIVKFGEHTGWHSEHVNEPELIHTWDTSQVIEFMLGYRALLQREIAYRTLALSRVKVRPKPPEAKSLDTKREPVRALGKRYEIYTRLKADFVDPWLGGKRTNFSALLYGPPGTGKTSLVKGLADALGFPLINLSVSDFLGGGGSAVEARAKAIFQMLEAQKDCVIFFDEIDSFLLDRNSQHYRDQDTLFQFLTPGMLTKINDLREAKRSIFVIAANYENRIDPAIKRPGRIDQRYLLLPPDKAKRQAILEGRNIKSAVARDPVIVAASLFMGYSELNGAVDRVDAGTKENTAKASVATLSATLKEVGASTGAEVYGQRVFNENVYPCEEAACLYLLAKEVGLDKDFEDGFRAAAERAATNENDREGRINQTWTDIMVWAEKIQATPLRR